MKARWIILLLAAAASTIALLLRPSGSAEKTVAAHIGRGESPTSPADAPVYHPTDLERELAFTMGRTNPLSPRQLPEFDPNLPLYHHETFAESLVNKVNPASLEKYEGSYTLGELRRKNESGSPSISFNTSWILENSTPRAGLKIERNPATGKYEVSGGELFLPSSGVGVSYEKDEESGETKTFLNLKRDF